MLLYKMRHGINKALTVPFQTWYISAGNRY